jgi:hypothetical protein
MPGDRPEDRPYTRCKFVLAYSRSPVIGRRRGNLADNRTRGAVDQTVMEAARHVGVVFHVADQRGSAADGAPTEPAERQESRLHGGCTAHGKTAVARADNAQRPYRTARDRPARDGGLVFDTRVAGYRAADHARVRSHVGRGLCRRRGAAPAVRVPLGSRRAGPDLPVLEALWPGPVYLYHVDSDIERGRQAVGRTGPGDLHVFGGRCGHPCFRAAVPNGMREVFSNETPTGSDVFRVSSTGRASLRDGRQPPASL